MLSLSQPMKILLLFLSVCALFPVYSDTTAIDGIKTTPLIDVQISADTIAFGDTIQINCTPTVDSLEFTLQAPKEWQKFSTIRLIATEKKGPGTLVSFSLYSHKLCTIPSLVFSYPLSDTTTDTVSTGDITLFVKNVLEDTAAVTVTTGEPIKTGKYPYWIWIVGSLFLLILTLLVIFRKRVLAFIDSILNSKSALQKRKYVIPPYQEARKLLKALEEADYLSKGMYKTYTFELSDILKRYIGRRYTCQVHESTSTEFRDWIEESSLDKDLKSLLNKFITETDPVKFANINPGVKTLTDLLVNVKDFMEKTKPVPVTTDQAKSTTTKKKSEA